MWSAQIRLGQTCCLRFHSVFRFRSKAAFNSSNEPCLSRTRRVEFGLAEEENVEHRRRRELVTQKFGTSVNSCMRACKEGEDPITAYTHMPYAVTWPTPLLSYFVSSWYDLYSSIVYK
jgi:hypothetical protein